MAAPALSRFLLTLALTALLPGFAWGDGGDGTKKQEKEGHRVKLIYYVTGLGSQAEADEIAAAVKALPTVTQVVPNLARGYVRVLFDSHELSYHQVAQAIADAGKNHGKAYDPRVVVSIPDYAKSEITPKIKAIFADPVLQSWIRIEPIDAAKGTFFVHFLALVPDPKKTGTQGFNGGYLTHPIHMVPPTGLALPFKYLSEDSPEIPHGTRCHSPDEIAPGPPAGICLWSCAGRGAIVPAHESRDVLQVFLAPAAVLVRVDHAHADAHEVRDPDAPARVQADQGEHRPAHAPLSREQRAAHQRELRRARRPCRR